MLTCADGMYCGTKVRIKAACPLSPLLLAGFIWKLQGMISDFIYPERRLPRDVALCRVARHVKAPSSHHTHSNKKCPALRRGIFRSRIGSPAGSPLLRSVPAFAGLLPCHRHGKFACGEPAAHPHPDCQRRRFATARAAPAPLPHRSWGRGGPKGR